MTNRSKIRILLVEDDLNLGFLLTEFLETSGFYVKLYRDGENGLKGFNNDVYDFCILDVMLPMMDGFALAAGIREKNRNIPIIMLTARSMKEEKLKGYALGIDDYITKPFDEDVLLCKINAIMTRAGKEPATGDCFPLAIGEYRFDPLNQRLIYKGAEKRLTKKETEVLELLAGTKNQLVKRTYILNSVWGNDDYFTGRSLDVFVTKLRKYLENDPTVKIESIPTVGYILTDTR